MSARFQHELAQIIGEEIERQLTTMASGILIDHAGYKYVCGRIAGLRQAIEYFSEAEKNASER